jgi:hypothetical protein
VDVTAVWASDLIPPALAATDSFAAGGAGEPGKSMQMAPTAVLQVGFCTDELVTFDGNTQGPIERKEKRSKKERLHRMDENRK